MKRILSVFILLAISSSLTFGQHVQQPKKTVGLDQNMDQYFVKNTNQIRSAFWSSNMSTASDWTYKNDPSATLATHWTWISDTSQASAYFKEYVHSGSYMQSPTANQGVWYFDGITNLVTSNYGYENSTLTNSTAISTIGHPAVTLKFYQLYKNLNNDSTLIEVSNDSITWHQFMANPSITNNGHGNTYVYGLKQFNISTWAANQAHVWIRFRFVGQLTSAANPYYGGYGWMLDDVSLEDTPNNLIEYNNIFAGFVSGSFYVTPQPVIYDGYTQLPSGQSFPVSMAAAFTNNGAIPQTNVQLSLKDVTTGTIATAPTPIASMPVSELDTMQTNNVDTLGGTIGTFSYNLSFQSDSISPNYNSDTVVVTVNDKTKGQYSRDDDYYTGSRTYNGYATTGSVNSYQMANLVDVTTADPIYAKSISVVIAEGTSVNAPIKAILYQGWNRVDIAESDYHFVQANEIVSTVGSAPYATELFFNDYTNTQLKKDSAYFIAIQTYGGTDTVFLGAGSSVPQPDYTMWIYDTDNTWYYFGRATNPSMIRLNTLPTNPAGIKENSLNASLFQNMPNPASNSTRISYELKQTDNVVVEIYNFMGQRIRYYNQGRKIAGAYNIDVDLADFASGTYFYTLKTDKNIATKKMIVVK